MDSSHPDPLGVRALMARDWAGLERLKQQARVKAHVRRTAEQRLAAASEMRQYVHDLRPDLDWAVARADDLASHVRVAELLRRADAKLRR